MINLSADERAAKMKQILHRENAALAEFVIELAEFDRLKQYLERGYRSVWDFCRRELGLSERAAYYRIAAARELQKNPQLAEQIRDRRLCITTLAMLSKVTTEENCQALVAEAAGKSKREVEQIVARIDPKPVPADVVRAVTPSIAPGQVKTEVLTDTLFRKYMTVDQQYEDLLKAARDALSHAKPSASELDILKEGLRRIVRDAEKRKGIVDKPRKDREATGGDIPQSVRRIVWKRDQHKCQWRTADGQICGSTNKVVFHHKQDRAKGGLGSPENIIFLCAVHNLYAAEIAWGDDHMDRFRKQPPKSASEELQSQLEFT
jgi:hypothetical protein